MTPNDIEVLIHCYVTPAPHPRRSAPAVHDAIDMLLREGLIYETNEGCYGTTERGAAHITQLCDTPFPKQVWVDEHGRVIDV